MPKKKQKKKTSTAHNNLMKFFLTQVLQIPQTKTFAM